MTALGVILLQVNATMSITVLYINAAHWYILDADHIRILSIVSNLPQPSTPQGNSLTHMGLDHRGVWHWEQTVLAWDRRKSIKGDFCFPDWSHSVWEKGESLTALPYIQLMAKENIHFLSVSFFQLYLFHQDFIIQLLCDFWYSF